MTLFEKIQATILIPKSTWHLIKVRRELKVRPYLEVLDKPISKSKKRFALIVIVKSYFWSARLLPNCNCLPRSIALYQKLKSMGYAVHHRFGVLKSAPKDKFSAHAWVDLDGESLNETKNLNQFVVLKKSNENQ